MKYKTLLFDADDTLLDFHRAESAALTDTLVKHGLPCTPEILNRYSEINLSLWKRLELGAIEKPRLRIERFEILCNEFGFSVAPDVISDTYACRLATKSYTLDGAVELCAELSKRYRMYIVTNGTKDIQVGRLRGSGLLPYFEGFFISEDSGFEKPDRRYFKWVSSQIPELEKSTTLIIGDSLTSDMRGGMGFGIDTCWFNPKKKIVSNDLRLTYIVHSFYQLRELLTHEESI